MQLKYKFKGENLYMEQQKQNKKIKRYPPKMDIIFQVIFGEIGSENGKLKQEMTITN